LARTKPKDDAYAYPSLGQSALADVARAETRDLVIWRGTLADTAGQLEQKGGVAFGIKSEPVSFRAMRHLEMLPIGLGAQNRLGTVCELVLVRHALELCRVCRNTCRLRGDFLI